MKECLAEYEVFYIRSYVNCEYIEANRLFSSNVKRVGTFHSMRNAVSDDYVSYDLNSKIVFEI